MKKYIRKALILFVACIVLFATLDFIFRELKPVIHYLSQGAVFTALVIVLDYFEDKRRTQRRTGSHFKKKQNYIPISTTSRLMKKVIFILFALVLFSCRQSSNQSALETSTSDSVELKKQEAWESAHRLDSMGNHREALLLRERTLSEYCPNSAECLQYKGLRCYIENKRDSANFYFDKTTRMCDMALRDSLDINIVTIKAFGLAFTDGDRSTRHFLNSLSTRHHDNQALQQLKESTEGIRNVVVVIKSLK